MDNLYIEIEIETKNNETAIYTSISSFLALYVYRYLQSRKNVKLNFVRLILPNDKGKLKLRSETLKHELTDNHILLKKTSSIQAIKDLKLPLYFKEGNTCIAGICAVCRELVSRNPNDDFKKLLGFKESCLLAPAETSVWTRFCELDTVEALSDLLAMIERQEFILEVPKELVRFEHHMNEPVRMHNIYKLARERANENITNRKDKVIIECTIPKEDLAVEHVFAEGISFTIADLLLYPLIVMIFDYLKPILNRFPLTHSWIEEINSFDPACKSILRNLIIYDVPEEVLNYLNSNLKIPSCEPTSLYKSDPKRYKPKNRIFTEQSAIDTALNKLKELQLDFNSNCLISYGEQIIDWNQIEPEHETSSALPKERLERKRQQLENLANAVASLAKPNDRIVDFCSGTGHLGILLALQLPQCTVILMENKAISLQKAKKRAEELNLNNCLFYQCNIDYFEGSFDIGTSLHACGTATDIVLQKCQQVQAKFVCCPCCYGSLQPMPHINYPLSNRFRQVLAEKEYLHLAHTADQAHELGVTDCKPDIIKQGQLCMDIVDTDRKLQAEEAGYQVILTRLQPEQCTPKNRLLVGQFVNRTKFLDS